LKATECSDSATNVAGISPEVILQKMQSNETPCLSNSKADLKIGQQKGSDNSRSSG
jgi:hypothetical protein